MSPEVQEVTDKLFKALDGIPREEAREALLQAQSKLLRGSDLNAGSVAHVLMAGTGAQGPVLLSDEAHPRHSIANLDYRVVDSGMPLALESDMPAIHESIEHELAKDRISNFFKDPELERLKLHERGNLPVFDRKVLDTANLLFDRFVQLAKEWQAPYGKPTTAGNLELLGMNVARFSAATLAHQKAVVPEGTSTDIVDAAIGTIGQINTVVVRVLGMVEIFLAAFALNDAARVDKFLAHWYQNAFARLEVSHRLAASLCLTDVPADFEVRAPWSHWSLIVPEGLFPPILEGKTEHAARFWCVGSEPLFIITNEGRAIDVLAHPDRPHGVIYETMRALIRSACLVLSGHPEDFKKERQHRPTARAGKKRHGPPDLEQAKFLLSTPVLVDCREMLHEALTGKTRNGSSPKVQFLVRGHSKMQAHGARRALRKHIWIQPFWKGPEGMCVLLRQHRVGDGKGES